MKMITGFLEPDSGSVRIDTISMANDPIAAKKLIGYLPEGAPAYGDMTPHSFLQFIAEIRGYVGGERDYRVSQAVEKTGLKISFASARRNAVQGATSDVSAWRRRSCTIQAC